MTATRSLVTVQGTAMPEATLCEDHWNDNDANNRAMQAAYASDDWNQDGVPATTTDNPDVSCIICGKGGGA